LLTKTPVATQEDDVAPRNTIVVKEGKMIPNFMFIIKGVAKLVLFCAFDTRRRRSFNKIIVGRIHDNPKTSA
jgi:hypothetical protein